MSSYVLGVDVGGTFTDVFAFDREAGRFEIAKVASTPGAQAEGFMAGLEASGAPAASIETIVHGTTVATNAILERKGAKCGLIATRGFRDTLELGRRTRPNNWGLTGSFEALIPRELRLDVIERIDAKGRVLVPLDEDELRAAVTTLRDAGCEALVIHFIHAYANPAHERRAGEIARGLWPNAFVSTGAEVLAEIREFERASGAALNGWVQPLMARYVGAAERRLGETGFAHRLLLMQGNGGMMSAPTACRAAAQTVLSGPAAGAIAAARLCRAAGFENVLACDMGGTSFDLTLIRGGQPATTTEKNMAYSVPLHLPLVDVHTIGSGGGSIARVDASGLLRVGPESAGAHPGPICYGRGGNAPTVTDANAILGRIDTASLAGGLAAADLERVRARMAETIGVPLGLDTEDAAAAVLAVAGNQMANAARMVSIEKGHDPREFILFAFGGAGPMHAVEIARGLGIPKVLVPRFPGITSALGCVLADVRHDYVRSLHCPLADVDPALGRSVLAEQAARGRALIESEGVAVTAVDMVHEADLLYRGQSHVFRVPIDDPGFDPERVRATFAAHYRRRFDIALPEMVPMLVNLRTTVIGRREPLDLASLSRTARDAGCFSSRSDAIDPLSRATGEAAGENAGAPRKGVRRVCFDGKWHEAAIVGRATLVPGMTVEGPAIIEQLDTTVPIEPGLAARVDGLGNLIIPVAPRAARVAMAAGVGAGTGAGTGAGSVARAGVGSVARAGVGSGAVTGSVARTGAGAGAGSRFGTGDTLDAVTLAVIQNGLGQIASEMDLVHQKTSFSPVISEAFDRANGIYDMHDGKIIAQGELGLPIFLGVMQETTKQVIEHKGPLDEGDVIIVNDPYFGGTHLMDVRMVKPFYYRGALWAYLANTGHWSDTGGMVPGGFCATATEIQQEGLRLPPVKLVRRGGLVQDVVDVIMSNIRVPEERVGDMRAQLGALSIGEQRLTALLDKYGEGTVRAAIAEMRRRSETQMRAHIEAIPDGTYRFSACVDSDGITDDILEVALDVRVEGSDIHFDYSRSSPPCRGPLNSVWATTMGSTLCGMKHLFPDVPINSGCFAPIHVERPRGTFLLAEYPRPVCGCAAEVSQRIMEALFGALGQAIPEDTFAGPAGTSGNFSLGGFDPESGRSYVMYLFTGGGYGGWNGGDGISNGTSTIGISKNQPIEVLEQHFPVLFESYALREGSAGAGRWRGGLGVSYKVRLLRGEAKASFMMDHGRTGPFGMLGGKPGAMNDIRISQAGALSRPAYGSKGDGFELAAGDWVLVNTPGGGGYGDPGDRPRELIERDLARRYLTREEAAVYRHPGGR